MILALVFALVAGDVVPQAEPTAPAAPPVAAAPALAPPTVISVVVTPPPKPARVCRESKQVGSLLPVKVCTRPGQTSPDDLDQFDLVQQRQAFKPRE
jgi:hypothetical protein